jgi:hypothetical protein
LAIFDELPYPFHKAMAQELLRTMLALYPNPAAAVALVVQNGIAAEDITPNQPPRQLWRELLLLGNIRGVTRDIVQAARQEFPRNSRAEFLDAVLAETTVPVSAEPTTASGQPAPFISGTDTVTKPEALLFFDDLTMPVGEVPGLITTLNGVLSQAPSVCLLRVTSPAGQFVGTGFRIGDKLVLTNEHVLFPKEQKATKVVADFLFDVDAKGLALAGTSLAGDVSTIVGNRDDDWAVIEVGGMNAAWPVVALDGAAAPKTGDRAYILQHPGGQRKRLGFVRNTIGDVSDRVVHYLTDTEPGASGSPVFDANSRCIALHHAGGEPQMVAGKPPVSKNEGIRISRVREALQAKGLL